MTSLLPLLLAAAAASPHVQVAWPMDAPPPTVVGGGQVVLEAAVDPRGQVTEVTVLRDTPPFTELLKKAVLRWTFRPPQKDGATVASRAVVAALFRPPALQGPTLGEKPRAAGEPSPGLPVPMAMAVPEYPANVVLPNAGLTGLDAQVVVEAEVDATGRVGHVRPVILREGFTEAAVRTAHLWQFRQGAPGYAVLLFGFRAPVMAAPSRH